MVFMQLGPNMTQTKLPSHEIVYRQIRDMVLFGDLAPGQAVTIQGISKTLNAGMTPVREALRRLIAEGALEFQGNRRISLPTPTLSQLSELAFARLTIEPHLTELAVPRITNDDISRLTAIDNALNIAIAQGNIHDYLQQNHLFHTTLYAISNADILTTIVDALWLKAGPSLRIMIGQSGTLNLPDKHRETLSALSERDAKGAANAIADDLRQGLDQIKLSLFD